MNMVYFSFVDELKRPGYKIKIHSQVRAMAEYFSNVFLFALNGKNLIIYKIGKKSVVVKEICIADGRIMRKRNPFDEYRILKKALNELSAFVDSRQIDFVYFRRIVPITPLLLKCIRSLRRRNIYVAYEYPTYPWKKEMIVTGKIPLLVVDLLFYRRIIKVVDQLVVLGKYNGNIEKVTETMNGVDVEMYPMSKIDNKGGIIRFIAVGHIMPQHGYDRLIRGIADYYGNGGKNVFLNIVGPEDGKTNLKILAKKLKVDKYIRFWGFQQGSKLDKIFDESDIGVDWLAQNKIHNNAILGSLKSREYLARGLPLIYAGNLDFVSRMGISKDFLIKVEGGTDTVDIKQIIEKYNQINTSSKAIREFARENLGWHRMMEPVVKKFLKEGQNKFSDSKHI